MITVRSGIPDDMASRETRQHVGKILGGSVEAINYCGCGQDSSKFPCPCPFILRLLHDVAQILTTVNRLSLLLLAEPMSPNNLLLPTTPKTANFRVCVGGGGMDAPGEN